MDQVPPGLVEGEAETLRRVAAANSPSRLGDNRLAAGSGSAWLDVARQSAQAIRRFARRPQVKVALPIVAVLHVVFFLWHGSEFFANIVEDDRQVSQIIAEGPPFATKLTPAEMVSAYQFMRSTGAVFAIVPDTADGLNYLGDFLDQVSALEDPDALSPDERADQESGLVELERRFLAGEPLDGRPQWTGLSSAG